MVTVSHTYGNCASGPGLRCPEAGRGKTEHFLCSSVIAAISALVAGLDHEAPEAFADVVSDVYRARICRERVHCRFEAARHHFWKMDFRQMAERHGTEDARSESASVIRGYAAQGIHHRKST